MLVRLVEVYRGYCFIIQTRLVILDAPSIFNHIISLFALVQMAVCIICRQQRLRTLASNQTLNMRLANVASGTGHAHTTDQVECELSLNPRFLPAIKYLPRDPRSRIALLSIPLQCALPSLPHQSIMWSNRHSLPNTGTAAAALHLNIAASATRI